MRLRRKLARWQEAGLIDASTRDRIADFEARGRSPVARHAVAVLGAGTVALGVVSVVASNWEAIPGRVKLAVDLALGSALAVATYAAVRRAADWRADALITLLWGFTLASIALVGQVYQLDAPAYRALLLWTVATGPLLLLGSSHELAGLGAAGLALTHAHCAWALLDHLVRRFDLGAAAAANLAACLVTASLLLWIVVPRCRWLVRHRPAFAETLGTVAWGAVLAAGFGAQFVWYGRMRAGDTLGWSLAVTGLLVAGVVLILPRLHPELDRRGRRALAAVLGVGWLLLALGTGFPRPSASAIGAILQVAWLAVNAWAAIACGLPRVFHVLTGLIALRVLAIYLEVFGSLLSTGIGLIVGGLLTLLAGWLWRRKSGDLAAALALRPGGGDDVA